MMPMNTTTLEELEKSQRHRELLEETVAVGIMFASKAFVQLLANPIVGPLTHKYIYSVSIKMLDFIPQIMKIN